MQKLPEVLERKKAVHVQRTNPLSERKKPILFQQ